MGSATALMATCGGLRFACLTLAVLLLVSSSCGEDRRATVVIQGFDPGRHKDLCKVACTMQRWESVEAVLVVWNNDRSLWPGCGCPILESDDWTVAGGKHAARLHFSSGDDLDNHYAVPGALGLPTRTALVMDDDVQTGLHCILALSAVYDDRRLQEAPRQGLQQAWAWFQ